ncbi:hypothetical protein HY933_01655 [Candidatus Falkowbacteria bacterium]|nr:hypothetical protein [Candidatus Falkowbacteria bacterium]
MWLLLAANSLTIAFAVTQQWSAPTIMWTYWVQSVLIGLFQCLKILQLKKFSTTGFTINNHPVLPTERTKRTTAGFFLLHYGFFHLIYGIFLASMSGSVDTFALFVAGLGFALNHCISYRVNRAQDETRAPNIGSMMFFPYLRVIPMHLALIVFFLLAGQGAFLVFFLLLKTAADVAMHVIEHWPGRQSG